MEPSLSLRRAFGLLNRVETSCKFLDYLNRVNGFTAHGLSICELSEKSKNTEEKSTEPYNLNSQQEV